MKKKLFYSKIFKEIQRKHVDKYVRHMYNNSIRKIHADFCIYSDFLYYDNYLAGLTDI